MKVTLVPSQIVVEESAEILTLTGRFGFTVIIILSEVSGLPVVQVNEDVNIQVTVSPSANVELK